MSNTSWKAGVNGDWFTAGNWTHGVPTGTTDVSITAFGTYTVSLSGSGRCALADAQFNRRNIPEIVRRHAEPWPDVRSGLRNRHPERQQHFR